MLHNFIAKISPTDTSPELGYKADTLTIGCRSNHGIRNFMLVQ